MNPWTLIVPSGGIGSRMGAERPKQYLEINGQPILLHTLRVLDEYFDNPVFIVPVANEWRDYVQRTLENHPLGGKAVLVSGGKERYDSVKNALSSLNTPWVAVHDAVRPFVNRVTVERLKEALSNYQAAIPVLELKESIRKRTQECTLAANRSAFVSVQTPQCFHSEVLKAAYEQSFDEALTDDASVVERLGVSIHCVFGNEENIKITTPTELIVATHRLEHR